MRLLKLVIDNYKCFAERTEFDFTAGNGGPGRNVFLIGGMNGAGKTSVMEAINICLYGEKEQVILDCINPGQLGRGKADSCFQLQFQEQNGSIATLERSWRATGPTSDITGGRLKQDVALHIDEPNYTSTEEDYYQSFMAKNIPEGITQFFFFDGEKIQDMAEDESAEYKLRVSMEAALGIENVRRLAEDIKTLRRQQRRNEVSDADVDLQENKLRGLQRKLEEIDAGLEEADQDLKDFEAESNGAEARFKSSFGFEATTVDEFKQAERKRSQLTSRLNEIESQIGNYVTDNLAAALLGEHLDELQRQVEREENARRATIFKEFAPELGNAIVGVILQRGARWCRPTLTEADTRDLQNAVEEVIREFQCRTEEAVVPVLGFSENDKARVLSRVREIQQSRPDRLKALLEQKNAIEDQLQKIEKDLQAFRPSEDRDQLMNELMNEITTWTQHIGQKREEQQSLEREREKISEQIDAAENDLEVVYQQHEVSRTAEAFIERCKTLEDLLEEYREALRESRIGQLQANTFEMYQALATKGDLISDITVDRDTYQITIRNRQGHVIQKKNLSAGEKEVFAISLLWGLAQTSELRLPIIIDTPLSRLDSSHRKAIVTEYFPHAGAQVILLSTDTEVDREYYMQLQPYLQHSVRLVFNLETESTTIEEGYFTWR